MNRKLIRIRLKDILRFFYSKIPFKIRHGYRYYREYMKTYNFLKESEYWSENQLKDYQESKLREIIKHAYESVPYYKELFDDLNIKPKDIRTLKDLEKIPYLTKEIVQREGDRLLSNKFRKKSLTIYQTGGSTGKPAKFYFEKVEMARENAFVQYIYDRIGFNKNDNVIQFQDSEIIREEQKINKECFYKKYPGQKLWKFSYANINTNTIDMVMKVIEKIDPTWIIAFPSTIYQLAKSLEGSSKEYKLKSLKGIIFCSETLYPLQFHVIKKIFNVKFLHVYGHTEHAAMGGTCEMGLNFHMEPLYGISEFIDCYEEKKELIATGFNNLAMPLIRYKTEDLFILSNKKCECKRNYQNIFSIEGRRSDFLYLKNGLKVSDIFCDFVIGENGKWLDEIFRFRIIQKEIGKCTLEYILINEKKYDMILENKIKKELEDYFFNQMEVTMKKVSDMPKTKRGKEKLIISYIDGV